MFNPNVTPFTSGNIDTTTRMLIGLKEKGQLQNYVQQHSSDPNLVSLALYVNNLDSAAKAPKQAPNQPTVLEERLAQMAPRQQMLPEEQGIGALPAQNMQTFADGGIVGYSEGGPNPAQGPAGQLAYNNEPVIRMAGGGIVAFAGGGGVNDGGYFDPNTGEFIINEQRDTRSFGQKLADAFGYEKGLNIDPAGGIPKPPAINPQGATNARDALLAAGRTSGANLAQQAAEQAAPTPPRASPSGLQALAANQAAAQSRVSAPAPAAGGMASTGNPQMDAYLSAMRQLAPKTAESRESELEARQKYLGENPAKAQLERLDKADQLALAERADARNMALMRAGFSMMASKSPYAMVGVGEGAQAGLADYQGALKDLKAAEREREKMREAVESAQYSAKQNDWDKVQSHLDKRDELQNTFNSHVASGLGSITSSQITSQAHLTGVREQAASTKDYLNAIRGSSLLETTRKNLAAEIQKAMPYATEAEREAAFQRKWQATLQANPLLAQLSGGATGGGGAVDTSGLKLLGVR